MDSMEALNKRLSIYYRATEIANDFRMKHGIPVKELCYDCSMPDEYQQQLHPTHCFNKYLKELRERYS